MSEVKRDAILVPKNPKHVNDREKTTVNGVIVNGFLMVPMTCVHRDQQYELVRVTDKGILMYTPEQGGKRP